MDIVIDAIEIWICIGLRMRWDPYFILVQVHLKVCQRPKMGSPQTPRKKNKGEKTLYHPCLLDHFWHNSQFTRKDKEGNENTLI